MNVLSILHYPVFGGPHNRNLRLNPYLAKRGFETVMLLPNDPGDAASRMRAAGVDVVQMPLHRFRNKLNPSFHLNLMAGFVPEIAAIRRLIRERAIGVVLVNGLLNPHGAIAAWREEIPIVWQVVDSGVPAPARITMMALLRRMADAVMFNGEAVAKMHVNGRPLDAPSMVYYPPVDTRKFFESPERRGATRSSLGIPGDASVVGMVANLNPLKGIEYFIRAAAILCASRPDLWFVLVGARSESHRAYLAKLEEEVAAAGIPKERLIFAGERSDVENLYPAMDVKLITSPRSEGTTTTAMEAMACGVPVVATNVGAVSEVVTDTVTGYMVQPCNASAIASATLRLLNDADLHRRMGQAGRLKAVDRFDITKCAQSHVNAYEMAIAYRHSRN